LTERFTTIYNLYPAQKVIFYNYIYRKKSTWSYISYTVKKNDRAVMLNAYESNNSAGELTPKLLVVNVNNKESAIKIYDMSK
jgi:hypothetical protein